MKLEVRQLVKSFQDKEVLSSVSFQVTSGKALGLLGRNGAGKTTTIRILMDVFKANQGEILLDGKPFHARSHQIGYMPEERGMYPKKKILEQLCYFAQLRGMSLKDAKESAKKWLKRLEMDSYANKRLDTLSKGNQQKIQLAQTLLCDPDIVILDEPFSGLDPVNSQILKDVIKELIAQEKIVIFSSHQMNYIEEFCEDIVILHHGKVVLDGNLKQIKKEQGNHRFVLKVEGYSAQELKGILEQQCSHLIQEIAIKDDFLIIEKQQEVTRNMLLQMLLDLKLEIEEISNYEPTLHDIFVWKAGDAS
ncbi:MAG: ATP-binding cassette domain-containing protein [Erysipelotrichaceae bacterium]|nr:ATP-binding cassette domain-containing protein [Erysipelotrichaceae bacterium]